MIIDLTKPVIHNRNDPYFMRVNIKHKPRWVARWMVRLQGLPFRLMPSDFVGWADDTITKSKDQLKATVMTCSGKHIVSACANLTGIWSNW